MHNSSHQPKRLRRTRGHGRFINYPEAPGEKLFEQITENEDGTRTKEVLYAAIDGEKIIFRATAEKEGLDAKDKE